MTEKEQLLKLEAEGKYVFHGSPDKDIKILEPRQGKHIPDLNKTEESILDGDPAVSATPYLEFAIFRAIINKVNVPFSHSSGFGLTNGNKNFRVSSQKVIDESQNKKGYVYVFNKKDFEPYSRDGEAGQDSMEWRSYVSIKPVHVIEVSSKDLPDRDLIEVTGTN